MFERTPNAVQAPETMPCHAWVSAVGEPFVRASEQLMEAAEQAVTVLAAWRATPQSAPWHAEGPVLADHVRRMLATLLAVGEGADLLAVEEFAREKDLRLDIAALAETLRNHQPLLTAFALTHDVAKPATAFFDAAEASKGAAEGFSQHGMRGERTMTEAEHVRYNKLLRAHAAAHPDATPTELMSGFFAAYGIGVHYDRHDAVGASPAYAEHRQQVVAHLGLPSSQGKMLAELIRYHIDTIRALNDRADRAAYATLAARAGKAGLNVDLFLDLALAVLFLDAVAGSVHAEKSAVRAQTELVVHMLRAEREAMPQRHAAREFAEAMAAKREEKTRLAAVGLDGESVFALLGTPIGPVRGEVMRKVQAAIDDPTASMDFGRHTAELQRRIAAFRAS